MDNLNPINFRDERRGRAATDFDKNTLKAFQIFKQELKQDLNTKEIFNVDGSSTQIISNSN